MKPYLVLLSIPLYFSLILWLLFKGQFSDPQLSNSINVLLVGTLVIITLYYALNISEQNEMIRKQTDRPFFHDLIFKILLRWRDELSKNAGYLSLLDFRFHFYGSKIEVTDLFSSFDPHKTLYIAEFKRMFRAEKDEMDVYFSELKPLEQSINNLAEEVWATELNEDIRKEIMQVEEFQRGSAFKWIMLNLFLSKKELEKHFASKAEYWKEYENVIFSEAIKEKARAIRKESIRLGAKSYALDEKLIDIILKIGKEYRISLRKLLP